MEIVQFSKHFQELSVPAAARAIFELGYDGVDLTVRPGGHVVPERVERDLPAAKRAIADHGLTLPMITTALTAADQPDAEATLATAAALGIAHVKTGYWPYRGFGDLRAQLDAARRQLDGLEALARKHGVRLGVHVHSGAYLTATAAGLATLLADRDPRHVGAYLDPGHMAVEGGNNGWKQSLDWLQSWVSLVALKDFGWFREGEGKAHWRAKVVPFRDGIVPWPEVFTCLRQIGFDGVFSVHSEYQGSGSWRDLTLPELIAQTRDDLAYLRPVMTAAGYRFRRGG